MYHGVGIINAVTICTTMLAEDIKDSIIVLLVGPVSLKFKDSRN